MNPAEVMASQWRTLQQQAALEWAAGNKIEATRLYELAGKLEEDIYNTCFILGISQIKLRRRAE